MSVLARDAGVDALRHQLLVYPATDLTLSHPSIDENGEGYLLTKTGMIWFADHYLGAGVRAGRPRQAPERVAALHARPRPASRRPPSSPPASTRCATRARPTPPPSPTPASPSSEQRYPTMIHGFISMGGVTTVTNEALDDAGAALRASLG